MNTRHLPFYLFGVVSLWLTTGVQLPAQIINVASINGDALDNPGLASTYTFGQNLDLTATGTTDWIQFGVNGSSSAFGNSNEKLGGSVGALDTIGALGISGSPAGGWVQQTSPVTVSYTNGSSLGNSTTSVTDTESSSHDYGTSAAASNWSSQTAWGNLDSYGERDDSALYFTITFNQAISSGNIYLAANTYSAEGELNASFNGGSSVTLSDTPGNGNNLNQVFDLQVSDIAAGTTLTLTWEDPNTDIDGSNNVSLTGVALDLTALPEPSTYALLAVGLAGLVMVTRFRRFAS